VWITLTLFISRTDVSVLYSVNTLHLNTFGRYFILPNCNIFSCFVSCFNSHFNSYILTSRILHTHVNAPSCPEHNGGILSRQGKWYSLYYFFFFFFFFHWHYSSLWALACPTRSFHFFPICHQLSPSSLNPSSFFLCSTFVTISFFTVWGC
jgi:hypothetical protein